MKEHKHRFQSTDEALRFGRTATEKDKKMLRLERAIYAAQYERLRERNPGILVAFNQLQELATQIQLCNEALSVIQ